MRWSCEEEIYAGTIGSGARGGIDWIEVEPRAQNIRGTIHIANVDFHLLDSLAEFFEKSRDRPRAAGLACRQDVEVHLADAKLELFRVLIRGRIRQFRRVVRGADSFESIGMDRESGYNRRKHGFRMRRFRADGKRELAKFRIFLPLIEQR